MIHAAIAANPAATALLACVLATVAFAETVRADFPLVAGGQAAPIVVDRSEGSQPDLALAIEDLRRSIAQAAKCDTPRLIFIPPRPARPIVVIGRAAKLQVNEEDVGYDGYVIRVEESRLLLAGPNPAGTANAIYDLLESALGVRFLDPGTDGTFVPSRNEIRIKTGQRGSRPAFAHRQVWYNNNVLARASEAERESLRKFARRNRSGGIPTIFRHYFADLVPPSVHFSERPELFAEIHGKRVPDGQLCTSHPYVAQLAVDHWIDRFTREPQLRVGSLSPNDGGRFCTCPTCANQGPDLTARLVHFMNDVTRRVNEQHPDRYLAFYAYGQMLEPPSGRGLRLQPNLIPVVARYGVCQVHPITESACQSNAKFRRQLEGWAEISRHTMTREYAYWWAVPDLTLSVLAENLRTYRKLGSIGISREYMRRGFMSDLMMRIDLQLQWNPSANADSLLDEALQARFGTADSGVRAAIDELRAVSDAVPPATVITGNAQSAAGLYQPATLRAVVERLDRLAGEAEEPVGARIAAEADLLRAALLHLEAVDATDRYKLTGRPGDLAVAAQRAADAGRLARRLETNGRLGANSVDDLAELATQLAWPGLSAPLSGVFNYEDNMARGGFSRRDASQIDGFQPGAHGLILLPGKIGRVAYTFSAQPGQHFQRADLHDLVMHGSQTRVELKVNATVHPVADGLPHDDRERVYELTPLVRGSDQFTLIFWVENSTQKTVLALDHWEVSGEVQ